jgi:hypothetical protein
MQLDIYAVRITGRTGHQRDNDHWRIGAYLRHRPEAYEDCHGPGGGASYDPTDLPRATFGSKDDADSIILFMHRRYPGVELTRVKFVEVSDG